MIKILRFLSNLRFAIFLLLTIAFCSTLGSIVEQNKSLEFYQSNYPIENSLFGIINWKFIIFLQLDHLYQNIWFFSLLILLGISLMTCTFLQQLPMLRFSRHCHFIKNIKTKMDFQINAQIIKSTNFFYNLNKQRYFFFQQKKTFYASKGLIGRIAPIFVHCSIVLILLGSIFAAVFGFTAQELVPKTEISHIQNIAASGRFSTISQEPVRLNDFWITYRKNGQIKQFYSDLSILNEDGNEIKRQTISVNKPLVYKDLTIYQTDWSLIGLRVWTNDTIFQLPFFKTDNFDGKTNFVTLLPFNSLEERFNIIQLNGYQGNSYLYDLKGKLSKIIDVDEYIKENKLRFIDIIGLTGLQIKSDPGLPYIYFGFSFLMLSTILSYLSFSEIWLIKKFSTKQFMIGAKTTRAKNQLEIELFKFLLDSD